jgi:hypothetical protein
LEKISLQDDIWQIFSVFDNGIVGFLVNWFTTRRICIPKFICPFTSFIVYLANTSNAFILCFSISCFNCFFISFFINDLFLVIFYSPHILVTYRHLISSRMCNMLFFISRMFFFLISSLFLIFWFNFYTPQCSIDELYPVHNRFLPSLTFINT